MLSELMLTDELKVARTARISETAMNSICTYIYIIGFLGP